MNDQAIVLIIALCALAFVYLVYMVTNLIGLRMQIKAWERAQKQVQKSKDEEDHS